MFFVIAASSFSLFLGVSSFWGRENALEQAQRELESLEKEYGQLLEKRAEVESDEFVEREARDKLGLAREGEVVVVLPSDEILRRLVPVEQEEVFVGELPIWRQWVEMFFKI